MTDDLTDEEVRRGFDTALALINRLADTELPEDQERIVRLLTSVDSGFLPDVKGMVDAALDERDELRHRVADALGRLDRLSPQGSYTASILRGEA